MAWSPAFISALNSGATALVWRLSRINLPYTDNPGSAIAIGSATDSADSWLVEAPTIRAEASIWRSGAEEQIAGLKQLIVGRWHHLAVTFDGTNLTLYLDGDLDQHRVLSAGPVDAGSEPLTLGASKPGPWTDWLQGTLDDVRVSDVARHAWELDPNGG